MDYLMTLVQFFYSARAFYYGVDETANPSYVSNRTLSETRHTRETFEFQSGWLLEIKQKLLP